MATKFRSLAVVTDAPTGDKRRLADGVVSSAPTPMPIAWTREDIGAHNGAVTLGAIDSMEMEGSGEIWATWRLFDDVDPQKMPRLAEDVAELRKLIDEGVVGLSIDPDDYEEVIVEAGTDTPITEEALADNPDIKLERLVTQARIRSATFVRIPAFVETNHTTTVLEDGALTASVSGDTKLPVLEDREHEWDGPGAASRVFDAYSDDEGNVDRSRAGRAFLWVDGDGTKRGDYKLGFADIMDGELRIIPRGVAATAGGRGVDSTDIPDEDKDGVRSRICSLYARIRESFEDWPECPFDRSEETAALIASMTLDTRVAFESFAAPVAIDAPTPMTYDFERGVVYGHIFQHGVCHVGIPHECRTPPVDEDFRHFHVYPVETTEGTVFAGRITAGGNHPDRSLSLTAVRRAYDDKTTVAYVRASVDDHGIFVCGPIERDLDSETLGVLSRRKVSGHWPEVGNEGDIFLAEILALAEGRPEDSEPGFPIGVHMRNGRMVGLTAALGPEPTVPAITVERQGKPETFQMTPEGLAALFREAYRLMEAEKADRELATKARAALMSAMTADAEMMRADLARAIGE